MAPKYIFPTLFCENERNIEMYKNTFGLTRLHVRAWKTLELH